MKVEKHCIFCGNTPDNKSREHVIPRWLIEMTGKPNRQAHFGFQKNSDIKDRIFAFDKFTFPACSSCNTKYSRLEAKAKSHITAIINQEQISTEDLSDLLDWLDKVRVGLWLGMRILDGDMAHIEPNFHIETRMGQYDRMLIIEKSDSQRSKLNVGGIETLCFALMPSAFILIINNYYFTNISTISLCSNRLGFPSFSKIALDDKSDKIEAKFVEARGYCKSPVLRKNILEKGRIFFQPIFSFNLMKTEKGEQPKEKYFNIPYVKAHSLNFSEGKGNIFEQIQNGIREYGVNDKISLEPNHIHTDESIYKKSAINILEWQLWLIKDSDNPSFLIKLSKEQREYVKSKYRLAREINLMFINKYK